MKIGDFVKIIPARIVNKGSIPPNGLVGTIENCRLHLDFYLFFVKIPDGRDFACREYELMKIPEVDYHYNGILQAGSGTYVEHKGECGMITAIRKYPNGSSSMVGNRFEICALVKFSSGSEKECRVLNLKLSSPEMYFSSQVVEA
jgi:hypothetical protein